MPGTRLVWGVGVQSERRLITLFSNQVDKCGKSMKLIILKRNIDYHTLCFLSSVLLKSKRTEIWAACAVYLVHSVSQSGQIEELSAQEN